jgi:hypothetical protein
MKHVGTKAGPQQQQQQPPLPTPTAKCAHGQGCDRDALKGPDRLCPVHLGQMLLNLEDWDRNRDEDEDEDD